ncbi:hypothetical protein GGF32_004841 [Allomyces javanicus]|nr:hypothetical protein GGF32_004841 [Allomyces javanicus]
MVEWKYNFVKNRKKASSAVDSGAESDAESDASMEGAASSSTAPPTTTGRGASLAMAVVRDLAGSDSDNDVDSDVELDAESAAPMEDAALLSTAPPTSTGRSASLATAITHELAGSDSDNDVDSDSESDAESTAPMEDAVSASMAPPMITSRCASLATAVALCESAGSGLTKEYDPPLNKRQSAAEFNDLDLILAMTRSRVCKCSLTILVSRSAKVAVNRHNSGLATCLPAKRRDSKLCARNRLPQFQMLIVTMLSLCMVAVFHRLTLVLFM